MVQYWEIGDYENALCSFEIGLKIIEMFSYEKNIKEQQSNEETVRIACINLKIVACMCKLNRHVDVSSILKEIHSVLEGMKDNGEADFKLYKQTICDVYFDFELNNYSLDGFLT